MSVARRWSRRWRRQLVGDLADLGYPAELVARWAWVTPGTVAHVIATRLDPGAVPGPEGPPS